MRVTHETALKEQEIIRLNQKNKIQQQRLRITVSNFLIVGLLGTLLISGAIIGLPLVESLEPPILKRSEMTEILSRANIIYLGERHDRISDRQKQLEIIQELYQQTVELQEAADAKGQVKIVGMTFFTPRRIG